MHDGHITDNLDMSDGRDRALLSRAIKRRWPIDDEVCAAAIAQLTRLMNSEDDRAANGAIRNLLTAMAQNQADEHLERKEQRLDDGQPTEGLTIRVVREDKLPDGDAA